jgi:hypothetical protein
MSPFRPTRTTQQSTSETYQGRMPAVLDEQRHLLGRDTPVLQLGHLKIDFEAIRVSSLRPRSMTTAAARRATSTARTAAPSLPGSGGADGPGTRLTTGRPPVAAGGSARAASRSAALPPPPAGVTSATGWRGTGRGARQGRCRDDPARLAGRRPAKTWRAPERGMGTPLADLMGCCQRKCAGARPGGGCPGDDWRLSWRTDRAPQAGRLIED